MTRPAKIKNFSTTVDLLFAEMMAIKRRQDQLEQMLKIIMDRMKND